MASPSHDLIPTWQVRITGSDGVIVGGGILVPGNRIVTCVHVVNAALRRSPGPDPPEPEHLVYVDAPSPTAERRISAQVIDATWNSDRDTTLLLLNGDLPRPSARLRTRLVEIRESRTPLPVRVLGFPASSTAGRSVDAFVRPGSGTLPGRVQVDIELTQPAGFERGFSGCGVEDPRDGSVIGILTSALDDGSGRGGRIGLMEPIELLDTLAADTAPGHSTTFGRRTGELKRVLSALRFDAVSQAYDTAQEGRDLHDIAHGLPTAWEAFVELSGLAPRADGLPREVVFVEEVAKRRIGDPRSLRSYTDGLCASEVPPDPLALLRATNAPAPASPSAPASASLIISVEELDGDPGAAHRYHLSHWIRDAHGITLGESRAA